MSVRVAILVAILNGAIDDDDNTGFAGDQPSSSEFVQALWIAESGGVLKVATSDGTLLFELGEAAGLRAVAVDDRQNQVWAYGATATS